MADVGDEEIVARTVRGGERGRHSTELRILLPALQDRIVDSLVEPLRSIHHLRCGEAVDPYVPLTEVQGEMRECAESGSARETANPAVAKPVSDEKRECLFLKILRQVGAREAGRDDRLAARESDGQIVIVVVRPESAALRRGANFHAYGRGERLESFSSENGRERPASGVTLILLRIGHALARLSGS